MRQISIMKFQEASHSPRQSWFGIFVRVLVKWVGGPRAPRPSQWYDSDGAHRGF